MPPPLAVFVRAFLVFCTPLTRKPFRSWSLLRIFPRELLRRIDLKTLDRWRVPASRGSGSLGGGGLLGGDLRAAASRVQALHTLALTLPPLRRYDRAGTSA